MAGRGPAPKAPSQRRTRHVPQRGDWQATPGWGWQHGEIPAPPTGLLKRSIETWQAWFRSWFAAHWTEDNLPQLQLTIRYWDQVQRAIDAPFIEADGPRGGTAYYRRPSPMTELRQHMDSLGITPKGQQDRRWERPPVQATDGATPPPEAAAAVPPPYAGLRRVK